MKYSKILLVLMVLVCLAFQACAVPVSPNHNSSIIMGNGSNNTTVSSGSKIAMASSGLNKTTVSSGSNTTMASSGLNKTTVSSGSNTTMKSSGDYLNPNNISQVASFPWYTTGGSFYSQAVPVATFSPFREYYVTSGIPIVGGIFSTPAKFDIVQRTPSMVYYGTGQALPYTQYVSTMPSNTNDLWVQGATNWAQYVVTPVGTWIQLVANAPLGGSAGVYEIVQTDTSTVKYNTYQFNQGYNTMNFNAAQVGRHMLYFVVNNQPSNVVVVDVFAQTTTG
jgi:hypothetical protein